MSEATLDPFGSWTVGRMVPMPGRLPQGWKVERLTDVALLESGHTPSRRRPDYWGGDVPWVSLNDLAALTEPSIATTLEGITRLGLTNSSARLLPAGTVIFSRTASVGKSSILAIPMATTQDFANYVCGPEVHNQYLMYLFRFQQSTWKQLMAGSIHNTIYMPVFKTLQVLLPPLAEQQAIAEALGDTDELIAALEALIAKKRDIKRGAMQELLTGHRRLPGFHGEWTKRPLGSSIAIRNEKVQTLENPTAKVCIELEQMQSARSAIDRFEDASNRTSIKYKFLPDDVLFGRLRPYLRKYWIADREGVCSTEIWPLVAPRGEIDQRFLFCIVQTDNFIEAASAAYGTHMPRADWKMITQFVIQLPPTSAEQRAIAGVLSDMEAEIAALEGKLAKARAVKQGMMQVLLTGEVRLV
jgi:type I restriction enzyme S subunit